MIGTVSGTRRLTLLWPEENRSERPRRERRPVGRCALCGGEIVWGESYHADGRRLVHMRCEIGAWRREE